MGKLYYGVLFDELFLSFRMIKCIGHEYILSIVINGYKGAY